MSANVLKSAFVALLASFLITAAAPEVNALDKGGRFFAYGVGQRSCEDYLKFREKRLETLEQHERYTKDELYEIVDKIVEHWIAGFLTAHNLYVEDTYNLAGEATMDDLKARLEKSCRANSKQYFAEAVVALAQELHPQRVKAEGAK